MERHQLGSDIQSLTIDRFAKEGIHLQQYYVQKVCTLHIMEDHYPYQIGLARTVITDGHPLGMLFATLFIIHLRLLFYFVFRTCSICFRNIDRLQMALGV